MYPFGSIFSGTQSAVPLPKFKKLDSGGLQVLEMTGRCCCALLLAAVSTSALAQAKVETMKDLAVVVVESNPQVVTQRAAVRGLEAKVSFARGGYLPSLDASGIVQPRTLKIAGTRDDSSFTAMEGSVEARWRVFDGLRTPNAVKVSNAELEAGRATLEGTISDVLLDLLQASADVRRDVQILGYARKQRSAIDEQLRGTVRRLSVGEATRTDENQAEARLAGSDAGILYASEEYAASASAFEAVSGRPAEAVPPLAPLAPLPASLDDALSIAQAESPYLRAAQKSARAAERGVAFAQGALSPSVDLVAGYEYLSGGVPNLFTGALPNDRSAIYGGAEVRWAIFNGGREYAEIRRSRALKDQRLSQVAESSRSIVQEVTTAWARWKAAVATIDVARTAVAANERATEGVRKEAVGGSRTVLDTLNAENELLAARITLERAVRNEYVAHATLLAATGQLDTDAILATD
jgi:outer membrane protein